MSSWPVGTTRDVQGSGSKPYVLKNVDDRVFTCTCPAWRNQGGKTPDVRTCKHLKSERGTQVEEARIASNGGPALIQALTQAPGPIVIVGPAASHTVTDEPHVTIPCLFDNPAPVTHVVRTLHAMGPGFQSVLQYRASLEDAVEKHMGRKLRQDEKAKLFGPPVLLANDWEDVEGLDPTGWWMSEKLDGVRAYWDGKDFISRQGNVFPAPEWFKADLPLHPLDGELWMDRRSFQATISIVKTQSAGDRWKAIKYVVFDIPHRTELFEERYEALEQLCMASPSKILKICYQTPCKDMDALRAELDRLHGEGAEGVMIRQPRSAYVKGRSSTLLKVKPFKDAEATVIGHEPGKKQHKGKCGGLILKMPNGKVFNVNAGAETVRLNPPKVGTVVTYRYTELTDGGIPKCASFVAVRDYE